MERSESTIAVHFSSAVTKAWSGRRPPLHGAVGGDGDDGQAINRPEFARDFPRRAGHAREAQVAAEEALVADARERFLLPR
jgi:hypothetical protein